MADNSLVSISICLSDIPKDKIKQAANGKRYANFIVAKRKEKSQYDETHTVFMSQDKSEREAKVDKVYVGGGKELAPAVNAVTIEDVESMQIAPVDDDLPFA